MIRVPGVVAIFFCFLLVVAAGANANDCKFVRVEINPIAPGRTDIFIGRTEQIEVRFDNDKTDGTIEVFPEPPMTVISRRSKTKCFIDGGVWVRNSVYASDNNEILMTHEFSGSNDSLNFYNVQTCQRINQIDVSNSTWEIQGSEITVREQSVIEGKGSAAVKVYSLNASCHLSSCK